MLNLEEEIRKSNYPPEENKIFFEDLGVCNSGCKCQGKTLINIIDNQIEDIEVLTPKPFHWERLNKYYGKDSIKIINNKAYYYLYTDEDLENKTSIYSEKNKCWFDEDDYSLCDFNPIVLKCIYYNNEWFVGNTCDYFDEGIWNYDIIDRLEKLKDGLYEAIIENGCWSDYCWEYGCYEGDGDSAIKILRCVEEY